MRQLQGIGLEFSDLEDFRPTVRAGALDGRTPVLHRDLLGVFDLDLLALFDAVALGHEGPSFRCRGAAKLALFARWIAANVTQAGDENAQESAFSHKYARNLGELRCWPHTRPSSAQGEKTHA